MTIASSLSKAGPYACDGAQTEFPFGFRVLDKAHLAVFRNESELSGGYGVELTETGGKVVFASAPGAGDTVVILRDVPLTQETDLQNNTAFYPEILEAGYDKLTMICQQFAEELTRCVKVSAGSVNPENYWEILNSIKDACITAMQSSAASAANAGVVALDVSHIWGAITGNADLMNQALATAQELMEAKGAVEAAGEAARADLNVASTAALEFAKGQIEQGKNAALDLLDETTGSSVASVSLAIAEAIGAQGSITVAKVAAETALANAIKTAQEAGAAIDAATLAAAGAMSSSISAAGQVVASAVADAKQKCDQAASDAVADSQAAATAARSEVDAARSAALIAIAADKNAAVARYNEISAVLDSNLAATVAAKNDATTLLNSAKQVVDSGKETITATVDNGKTVIIGSVSSGESAIATLVSNESLKISTIVSNGSGTLAGVINQGKTSLSDMVNSGKSGIAALIDTGNGEIALAISNGKTQLAGLVSGNAGYIDQLNGIVSGGKTELSLAVTGGQSTLNGVVSSGTTSLNGVAADHRVTITDLVSGDGGLMAQLVERVNNPTDGLKRILEDTKAVGVSGLSAIVADGSAALQLRIAAGEEAIAGSVNSGTSAITGAVNSGTSSITQAQNAAISALGGSLSSALTAAQNALTAQYAAEAAAEAAANVNTEVANATVSTHNLSAAAHPALRESVTAQIGEHNTAAAAHQSLFQAKAPLASPVFTGTPTAPTAPPGTSTGQLANTAFVSAAISALDAPAGLSAPDYAGGVVCSNNTEYTAAMDGWIWVLICTAVDGVGGFADLTVNGSTFLIAKTFFYYSHSHSGALFPVRQGDVWKMNCPHFNPAAGSDDALRFYPVRQS